MSHVILIFFFTLQISNFSVRILTVTSPLDSPVEIREYSIQFSMETGFCKVSRNRKIISNFCNDQSGHSSQIKVNYYEICLPFLAFL